MIKFENDTQNFQIQLPYAYELPVIITVNIFINNNSKRLTIPATIFKRLKLQEKVMFSYNPETSKLYINFLPKNPNNGENEKLSKVINTGRGFFTTIPSKWCKSIKPKKAQLIKQPNTKATYEVQFHGLLQ